MYEAPSLNLVDPTKGFQGYDVPGFPIDKPQSSLPSTLLYSSMGLSGIGEIATIYQQVSSTRALGDYEQSIANTNARIASLQAKQIIEAGNALAAKKNLETRGIVGAVRAQQGASGIDVASGSSASVRSDIASAGEMDELTIKNNAARQAWGYETEAIEDTFKGQYAKLTAKSQETQSFLTGGLKAVSGPLGIYARYKSYGAPNRLPFDLSTT